MVTSRERLLAAIRHEETDRVPICPRIHHFLDDYYGCSCWVHELKAGKEFGYDPLIILPNCIPNYVYAPLPIDPGDILGNYDDLPDVHVKLDIKKFEDHVLVNRIIHTPEGDLSDKTKLPYIKRAGTLAMPVRLEYLIREPEDLRKITYLFPDPLKPKLRSPQRPLSDLRAIDEVVGEDGLTEVTCNGPVSTRLGYAYPMKNMLIAYFRDKDFLKSMLRIFHDQVMVETKAVLEAGIKMIFGTWYWEGMSAGWSPKIFRELFVPLIKEHVDLVHKYDATYHYYDDGAVMFIIDMLKECQIDLLSTVAPPPTGDVDLAEVKRRIGDKVCLKGYIDLWQVIHEGTPKTIEEEVRKAMKIAAPGGGLILGSSDSIREGTPLENLKAYFEAGRKYGRYK